MQEPIPSEYEGWWRITGTSQWVDDVGRMPRPLRLNIAGGWYHITSRGQWRERIYYENLSALQSGGSEEPGAKD